MLHFFPRRKNKVSIRFEQIQFFFWKKWHRCFYVYTNSKILCWSVMSACVCWCVGLKNPFACLCCMLTCVYTVRQCLCQCWGSGEILLCWRYLVFFLFVFFVTEVEWEIKKLRVTEVSMRSLCQGILVMSNTDQKCTTNTAQ